MTLSFVRRGAVALALSLAALPSLVAAQSGGTVRGHVTDASNGRALPDAQVTVDGTRIGGITNSSGDYTLTGVPAGARTVTVRRIGYQPATIQVSVGAGATAQADAALKVSAVNLSDVVVTGTGAPTERRRVGASVASVDSAVISKANAVTVDQAMQGKIPGAQITQNSGGPGGGGISVRLRGVNSFISGSDPLYIVDGVIVDNSSAQLSDLGIRSNPQNRLADLNPSDIERVEVIRGAAAAALYGSRANNGVVQIFTKRGRPGKPRVSLSTRYGTSELRKRLALNQYPFDAAGNPVTRFDYQDALFQTGQQTEVNLGIDGGNEQTTYYVNGAYNDETGIMRSTSSTRRSARVNLTQQVFPRLKLDFGANFVNTQNQFQVNGEGNGVLTAVLFAPTSFSFFPVNGIYPTP